MPTWLKVLLVIVLIAVAVVGTGAFVSYRWLRANRARLIETGRSVRSDGEAFGRGRDARQCVEESLRRLQSSPEFSNELKTRLFLKGCLSVAAEPAAFCESVPHQNEYAASAEWTINECRSHDAAEISRCSRVMQEVLTYCDSARAQRPYATQTSK